MWSTLLLTHLSQLAEDLIITNLLRGVVIDDAYATGSSLMPQVKLWYNHISILNLIHLSIDIYSHI